MSRSRWRRPHSVMRLFNTGIVRGASCRRGASLLRKLVERRKCAGARSALSLDHPSTVPKDRPHCFSRSGEHGRQTAAARGVTSTSRVFVTMPTGGRGQGRLLGDHLTKLHGRIRAAVTVLRCRRRRSVAARWLTHSNFGPQDADPLARVSWAADALMIR